MSLRTHNAPRERGEEHNPNHLAQTAVVRMRMVGAHTSPLVVGEQPLAGRSNYLIGNDPSKWRTEIPHRVLYKDVYPGIDLVYYGKPGHLEYGFTVACVKPEAIQLAFEGAESLDVIRHFSELFRFTQINSPKSVEIRLRYFF